MSRAICCVPKALKRIVLIGAGNRGRIYAEAIQRRPDLALVGLAELDETRRRSAGAEFQIPESALFSDWKKLLVSGQADGAVIATLDNAHVEPALACLEAGLDVLLEKPIAPGRNGAMTIVETAERTGRHVLVCHVLRYAPFFQTIRSALDSGRIGDVVSIQWSENVSASHMAHSYVRGRWSRRENSSPIILAKSSHDLDLMAWFAGRPPVSVRSISSRRFFRPEEAPAGAPARCTDGCPHASSCLFEARSVYVDGLPIRRSLARHWTHPAGFLSALSLGLPFLRYAIPGMAPWKHWPTDTITYDLTTAGIEQALRGGPFGRCVFHSDNDQPDHQETLIEFEGGVHAVFRLHGFSESDERTIRIDGTQGTIRARTGGGGKIEILTHAGKRGKLRAKFDLVGHSGADRALIDAFADLLHGRSRAVSIRESYISHELAFAADLSAASGGSVVRVPLQGGHPDRSPA